jgi:hypothetical protein
LCRKGVVSPFVNAIIREMGASNRLFVRSHFFATSPNNGGAISESGRARLACAPAAKTALACRREIWHSFDGVNTTIVAELDKSRATKHGSRSLFVTGNFIQRSSGTAFRPFLPSGQFGGPDPVRASGAEADLAGRR